ncbi:hypothetical protein EVJ58_g9939 [Rhodofomes roseus]|uniref:Transmembrane protein n=1 Tax=Rhodofomes roseus TaxID=34475 RepID=A0A4Y9XR75_9APHY|nr:hypothetical protein EVJ58_g9939 [Rhodofomes roseus]
MSASLKDNLLDLLEGKIDFEGQRQVENIAKFALIAAAVFSFIVGVLFQSLSVTFGIFGVAALVLLLTSARAGRALHERSGWFACSAIVSVTRDRGVGWACDFQLTAQRCYPLVDEYSLLYAMKLVDPVSSRRRRAATPTSRSTVGALSLDTQAVSTIAPSQPQWPGLHVQRRQRAAAKLSVRRTKKLYVAGGALDSQTTETQWLRDADNIAVTSAAVVSSPSALLSEGGRIGANESLPPPVTADLCAQVESTSLAKLQEQIRQLQDSAQELRRRADHEKALREKYEGIVDVQARVIQGLREHLDIYRLDDQQESQALRDDVWLPTTQEMLDAIAFLDADPYASQSGTVG